MKTVADELFKRFGKFALRVADIESSAIGDDRICLRRSIQVNGAILYYLARESPDAKAQANPPPFETLAASSPLDAADVAAAIRVGRPYLPQLLLQLQMPVWASALAAAPFNAGLLDAMTVAGGRAAIAPQGNQSAYGKSFALLITFENGPCVESAVAAGTMADAIEFGVSPLRAALLADEESLTAIAMKDNRLAALFQQSTLGSTTRVPPATTAPKKPKTL